MNAEQSALLYGLAALLFISVVIHFFSRSYHSKHIQLLHEENESKQQQLESLSLQLMQVQQTAQGLEQELKNLTLKKHELDVKLATMEETRANMLSFHEEKILLLEKNKEQLKLEFEHLANQIFEDKRRKFSLDSQESLGNILNPLKTQLEGFHKKIDDVYNNEGKERASLKTEIERLYLLNQKITEEAANLTDALKGNNKIQGAWGELQLDMILSQSGLQKGRDYLREHSIKEDGKTQRPDFIINLPEGKHVVIDSKVSLKDYARYIAAQSAAEKESAIKAHVSSIRSHIRGLGDKAYHQLKGVDTPDFVLMFLPIESAFALAFQVDDQLFSDAFEQRVVVVTPTTLLATLRTIGNLWSIERQNQNARKLADHAGKVYDKFRILVENMEKLGDQLNTVRTTYDNTWSSLKTGRGNLLSQAQKFVELGVRVKRELPSSVLEDVELDLDLDEHENNENLPHEN